MSKQYYESPVLIYRDLNISVRCDVITASTITDGIGDDSMHDLYLN